MESVFCNSLDGWIECEMIEEKLGSWEARKSDLADQRHVFIHIFPHVHSFYIRKVSSFNFIYFFT